jgi:ankyrin repeat protein
MVGGFVLCLGVVSAQQQSSAQSSAQVELTSAVGADDPAGIDAALGHGADINKQGAGGQTPLMSAVLGGKDKAVAALLKHNPDVTIGEKDGYTPMHGAGFQGRANIAQMLIHHGLDPMDRHSDGYIGMHRACWGNEQRHTDTVRAFLEGGVSPTAKASNGAKPIDMARNPATKELLKSWPSKKKEL